MKRSRLSFIFFISCVFLQACSSTENTYKLNQWLYTQERQTQAYNGLIDSSFPLAKAQYFTLKKQMSTKFEPEAGQLTKRYETLNRIQEEFKQRQVELDRKSQEMKVSWQNKVEINKQDPAYQPTQVFKKYAEKEHEALQNLGEQYQASQLAFTAALDAPAFGPYARQLPRSPWQAQQIIQQLTLEENQAAYNTALLAALEQKLETTPTQFEDLLPYASIASAVRVNQRDFMPLPRGQKIVTQDTEIRARKMVKDKLDPEIISLAQAFANKQTNIAGAASELQDIERGRFQQLVPLINSDKREAINTLFRQKRESLASNAIDEFDTSLQQVRQRSAGTLDYVEKKAYAKRLIAAHEQIISQSYRYRTEPQINRYLVTLQQERVDLLGPMIPAIEAQILNANDIKTVNSVLDGLISKADASTPIASRLKNTQAAQLERLSRFTPTRDFNALALRNFTAKNLNYESELTALYIGDFEGARLTPVSTASSSILSQYLVAFGQQCSAYLPPNKVPITRSECATERVTTDGWGFETGRTCVSYRDVPTGLYADPVLYSASKSLADKVGLNLLSETFSGDMFSSRSAADDILALGSDMSDLVALNQCSNAGLMRFQQNLYRFVKMQPALKLPSQITMADVRNIYQNSFSPENIDLAQLLDDLISENARGWTLNRYNAGSVGGINVARKTSDGFPVNVRASYSYNTLGQNSRGNVSLTFADGLPKCLYFSDAPNTCRSPSRGIINRYEKGRYVK